MPIPRLRTLLLADALGACLSAVLLGLVLPAFDERFGMPRQTLYGLALIAAVFALHGFLGWRVSGPAPKVWLRRILFANILYCGLTAGMVAWHYPVLTSLDLLYFPAEIALILVLVRVEWQAIRNL